MEGTGEWKAPPPPWPAILKRGTICGSTLKLDGVDHLQKFIDMLDSDDPKYGRVLQEHEFLKFCNYEIQKDEGICTDGEGGR